MSLYQQGKEGQSHSPLHDSATSNAHNCTKAVTSRFIEAMPVPREGHAVAQLVEALRYKSEGRGFDGHNPSDRTMALGLTQPLTEISTRNISWG
jgi:hypothetical protein